MIRYVNYTNNVTFLVGKLHKKFYFTYCMYLLSVLNASMPLNHYI